MEKEGSTAGFVLGLIGGILGIFAGLIFAMSVYGFTLLAESAGKSDPIGPIVAILAGIYFAVLNVLVIYGSFLMKKYVSLRKGAIMALVCGVLSFNLLAIIGGIIGLVKK